MKKSAKISIIISAVCVILAAVMLIGCDTTNNGSDETTDSTETTAVETEEVIVSGVDVTSNEEFSLKTTKAKMTMKIIDNVPYITSLTSADGTEYIADGKAEVTLPTLNSTLTFSAAETYVGERNDTGYKFTFTGKKERLELYVSSSRYFAGPFEFWGYIYNEGTGSVEYAPATYFGVSVKFDAIPTATTFRKESGMAEGWTRYDGTYYDGTGMYETELVAQATARATYTTNQNWNAGGDISMMYINTGAHGMYFAQEWSQGQLTAKGYSGNKVGLSVIIGDRGFYTAVPAGESMYLPSVYLGVYDGDMDDGSNDYKRWYLNCKAPENMIEDENEPLTQMDIQLGITKSVAQLGIQSVKFDYGWWSTEKAGTNNSWKTREGYLDMTASGYKTWLKRYKCDTVTEFNALANKNGLKLAFYVLLKDTEMDEEGVPTSVGENGHPEWFSNICVTGVGDSADLGNEECVEFYKQYLYNFFSTTGVTTWRSDFEPICRSSDQENRHRANGTDVQYWCTVGFSDLVDYLIDNIDGFRYESCSSGGSMKDLFTMTKASVINCDDSADYMSLHMSFYDSSYCIHPAQLQLPINSLTYTEGSQYYTGTANYIYGLRTQLTGGVMLSNWNGTNSGGVNEENEWKYTIATDYNEKVKPLIRNGDLYHILPRPDGVHWDGLEYVDADSENKIKAVVMIWKPSNEEGDSKTVKLRGLKEDVTYSITYTDHRKLNTQMTGKELMEEGLTIVFTDEVDSDFIYLKEVDTATTTAAATDAQ